MEAFQKQFKKEVKKLRDLPLSDSDLKELLGGRVNVHLYGDLKHMNSIDELISPYDCAIILFQWSPDGIGHWVAVIKHGNLLEYYDPYGKYIDWWLRKIDKNFAVESGQDHSYLSKLMIDSDYDLSYNEFPFQSMKNKSATCGRWSVIRCILKDMCLAEFKDLFLNVYGDDFVTLMTDPELFSM